MPAAGALIFALAALAVASPLDAISDVPFTLQADRMTADITSARYSAEGHAILYRKELTVAADRLILDRNSDTVIAEGHVLLIEGTAILTCDRVELKIPDLRGVIEKAEIRVLRGVEPDALRKDPEHAAMRGQTTAHLTAEKIERTGDRTFTLDSAMFTPCRCAKGTAPDWKIEASSAHVDADSGAWLIAPVFYAKNVPLMILPALYVPLGDRRSGLLLPRFERNAPKGFAPTLPLYLTFGRSWDATLEASYWTARGPAPGLELRWAPSQESRGALRGTVLFDFGELGANGWRTGRESPLVRFAVTGAHATRGALAVELNLSGDPAYAAELGETFMARQIEESVSRATYTITAERDVRAALGLALREDLRSRTYAGLAIDQLRTVSIFDHPLSSAIAYRFAELRLDVPPHPLAAPWLLGGARLAVHGFGAPSAEGPRFGRVDLRPAISGVAAAEGFGSLTGELALRLTGWSGARAGTSVHGGRIVPLLHTRLETVIARRFGSIEHRITPALLHLIAPAMAGEAPPALDLGDEIDRLRAVHQAAAELATSLWSTGSGRRIAGARARIGRDFGLRNDPSLGTSELLLDADLDLPLGDSGARARWSIEGALAIDPARLRELVARADLDLGSALTLGASWGQFADSAPRYALVGSEELVPSWHPDATAYVPDPIGEQQIAWNRFRGLALSALFRPFAPLAIGLGLGIDALGGPETLRYAEGRIAWRSPCDCWSAALRVAKSRDRSGPDLEFSLDLAQLGGAALDPSPGR